MRTVRKSFLERFRYLQPLYLCMEICFKKTKSWKEVSKPFEKAAKESGFEKKDLMKFIEEFRLRSK